MWTEEHRRIYREGDGYPSDKRSDDMKGFVVLPRRWVVERTFSWLGRNRRLAKDFGNLVETLVTFVTPSPRCVLAKDPSPRQVALNLSDAAPTDDVLAGEV